MPANAIVSGRAGTALLLEGERLFTIHVDSPEIEVPRQVSDLPYLFGEAADLVFLEDVETPAVRALLVEASVREEALSLFLAVLDDSLSDDGRSEAVLALQEILSGSAVEGPPSGMLESVAWEHLRNILYGRALPSAADLAGAHRVCNAAGAEAVLRFVHELQAAQGAIREINSAWDSIPTWVVGKDGLERERRRMVQTGGFYQMVCELTSGRVPHTAESAGPDTAIREEWRARIQSRQRRIRPAILVVLGSELAGVDANLGADLSRSHPHALPFLARVHVTGHEEWEFQRRSLRTAMETVTDLVARQRALRVGYLIEDSCRFFFILAAGEPLPERTLSRTVETVHEVMGEFFNPETVESHAVVLLPNVADSQEVDRSAHAQLQELEEVSAHRQTASDAPRFSFRYRWVVDRRSREAVSLFLALLLDGRQRGPGMETHPRSDLEFAAAAGDGTYSAFGVSVLFHDPPAMLRASTLYAGEAILAGYLGRAWDAGDAEPDEAEPGADDERAPHEVGHALQAWGDVIYKHFAEAIHPALRKVASLSAHGRSDQAQWRAGALDTLQKSMEQNLRGVLSEGGIPLAREVLNGLLKADAATLSPPIGSVATFRNAAAERIREFLRLDQLVDRARELEVELQRSEGSDGELVAGRTQAIDDELKRIESVHAQAKPLLALHLALDEAEDRLVAADLEASELLGTRPASAVDEGIAVQAPEQLRKDDGVFGRAQRSARAAFSRLFHHERRAIAPSPSDAPRLASPAAPAFHGFAQDRAAWQIAERLRWVDAYEGLLRQLKKGLEDHEEAIAATARYVRQEWRWLQRALTSGTRHQIPVWGPGDFRSHAEDHLQQLYAGGAQRLIDQRLAHSYAIRPAQPPDPSDTVASSWGELEEVLNAAAPPVADESAVETLALLLERRGGEGAGDLLLNVLQMLLDTAAPLAQARFSEKTLPLPLRCIYCHSELYQLFRRDAQCDHLLRELGAAYVDNGDPHRVTVCFALHGIPAAALRKVLSIRSHRSAVDELPGSAADDQVPVESGRMREGVQLLELVVLAKALGILTRAPDGYVFESQKFPGDLLLVVDELAMPGNGRETEDRLRNAVDTALAIPSGIDALRRAADRTDVSYLEREVIADTLNEFQTRSTLWSKPTAT